MSTIDQEAATVSIESITAELRQLRARIDFQRDNTHTWPTKDEELAADLLRYDRRLLKAAAMLRVASSGGARGFAELSEAERLDIEHSLDVCGHGVRPSAEEGSERERA